jgi:beta-glucosidase
MKKLLLTGFFMASASTFFGQSKIEYNLCDLDFRPISLHNDLPQNSIYTNPKASAAARVSDVINRLTFDEKLTLTGGWNSMHFPGIPRLGLSPVYFSDASQGIHVKNLCVKVGKSTSFPCELALAATWDPELAYTYAKSIGDECQAWGINVLLGPGLNMYRNSEGGRNFEYMGEDPFLTSAMTVQYVKGLQSTGTIATIKHFLGNEQEFARHIVDVKIGERALREIYLRPFEECIKKGNALAVMTGNNQVNGFPGAADTPLSSDVLRKEYGFKGIIMSDWANSMFWKDQLNLELKSGHSLLMADNKIFADYIKRKSSNILKEKAQLKKS